MSLDQMISPPRNFKELLEVHGDWCEKCLDEEEYARHLLDEIDRFLQLAFWRKSRYRSWLAIETCRELAQQLNQDENYVWILFTFLTNLEMLYGLSGLDW